MSLLNFKDFLTSGACLQTGQNCFKVLVGPFQQVPIEEVQTSKSTTFLYKAEFWDFLSRAEQKPQDKSEQKAQDFVYSAKAAFEFNREEIIGWFQKEESEKPSVDWLDVEEASFKQQYDWSQNHFQQKTLAKTVPIISQRSPTILNHKNKIWLLKELIKKNNYGWTYAFFDGETGMIGHTPELLLDWDVAEGRAQTVAVAGTVPQGEGAKAEISSDPKIRQEHNYVIDDIQSKLSNSSMIQEPTQILELKHLLHLQTRFIIPMSKPEDFLSCISSLHPTAAMGIFPSQLKDLKEFSQFDIQKSRSLFAGPFGVIEQQKALVVVTIRGLTFNSEGCSMYSGCGITAESQYQLELAELENKRNSVKKMLGLLSE